MKWSKYNFLFKSEKYGYLLFNSQSNTFAELDEKTYNEIEKIRKNPDNYDYNENFGLYIQLLTGKILLEDHENPLIDMKFQIDLTKYSSSILYLTIAPTTECNFNCPYCFEESRKPVHMSEETENNIIEFMKKMNTGLYKITWYGGEPLLGWNNIQSLTKKFRENNLKFTASMVSNGYAFDAEKVSKLKEYNIKNIQITLDGLEQTHNKKRPLLNGDNTFKKILENIHLILEKAECYLSIRVNIDKSNIDEYHELHGFLMEKFSKFKSRFNVYPGIVLNLEQSCSNSSSCLLDKSGVSNFMISAYKNHNIKDLQFFPDVIFQACTANALYRYVVGPDGELYKCWHHIGNPEMVVGNVDEEKMSLNTQLIAKFITGTEPFTDEKCVNCFFLPLCNGGCPHLVYLNRFENKKFDLCSVFKSNIKEFLEIYYEIKNSQIN